jgi:DNA-directed RNA polymerase sigma subunit (sigma70/sigma32)
MIQNAGLVRSAKRMQPTVFDLLQISTTYKKPTSDCYHPQEVATKLTLHPETPDNTEQMARLRLSLDEAFAVQGW